MKMNKEKKLKFFSPSIFPKSRKGDKIISVYWFAVLFIVAAVVVYMVISFYGKPYDIREAEADILTTKVASCLSEAGYIKEEFLSYNSEEDFLEKCNLNFQTEDTYGWREQGQYYIDINIINFNSGQLVSFIRLGNPNLKESCILEGKTIPVCIKRTFYSLDKNNNQYKINILSIVRKTEKNVQ